MAGAGPSPQVHLIDDDDIILELMATLVESIGARASGFRSATVFLDQYSPRPLTAPAPADEALIETFQRQMRNAITLIRAWLYEQKSGPEPESPRRSGRVGPTVL